MGKETIVAAHPHETAGGHEAGQSQSSVLGQEEVTQVTCFSLLRTGFQDLGSGITMVV